MAGSAVGDRKNYRYVTDCYKKLDGGQHCATLLSRPYLSLDLFVVLAATFFGPPCRDLPEPWPDAPLPAFGFG